MEITDYETLDLTITPYTCLVTTLQYTQTQPPTFYQLESGTFAFSEYQALDKDGVVCHHPLEYEIIGLPTFITLDTFTFTVTDPPLDAASSYLIEVKCSFVDYT